MSSRWRSTAAVALLAVTALYCAPHRASLDEITARAERPSWVAIVTYPQQVTVSVDRERLSRVGDALDVWLRSEYASPQTLIAEPGQHAEYSASVTEERIDCRQATLTTLSVSRYGVNGASVSSYRFQEPKPDRAVPGSVGDDIVRNLCDYVATHKDLVRQP